MFGLLRSPRLRHPSSARSRLARPRLEVLEDRTNPSTITIAVTYGLGKSVTVSGALTNTSTPANQSITIAGVANGTTTTNASGHYSITLTASNLGMLSARATDGSSNVPTISLTDQAPVITSFTAIQGEDDIWTFTGTVTYFRTFETLTILFGGQPVSIQNQSTTADGTGHFELSILMNGTQSDTGTVTAKAQSPWGTMSTVVMDLV